jgi:hypothetical protein
MSAVDSDKHNQMTRLMLGYLCIAGEREASLVAKVEILDRFDLPDAEIAGICGISGQAVRDARLRSKKATKKKK